MLKNKMPNQNDAIDAIKTLLNYLGEDINREGLHETPQRVLKAFQEYTRGYKEDPKECLSKIFHEVSGYKDLVILKSIPFQSLCEHHLAPIMGLAHVGYYPNGYVVGLSKLARTVHIFARRLQIQERMTVDIAEAIQKHLNARGAFCIIEAHHDCMSMRGVNLQGTKMITSHFTGILSEDTSMQGQCFQRSKDS